MVLGSAQTDLAKRARLWQMSFDGFIDGWIRRCGQAGWDCLFWFFGGGRWRFVPSVDGFHKCVGPKSRRSFPEFKSLEFIPDEIATGDHFIPFQTPEAGRDVGSGGDSGRVHAGSGFAGSVGQIFTIFHG